MVSFSYRVVISTRVELMGVHVDVTGGRADKRGDFLFDQNATSAFGMIDEVNHQESRHLGNERPLRYGGHHFFVIFGLSGIVNPSGCLRHRKFRQNETILVVWRS